MKARMSTTLFRSTQKHRAARPVMLSLILILVSTLIGGTGEYASAAGKSYVLVGAGDISKCGSSSNDNDERTARLLDRIPGTVFTTGDNVYDKGTAQEFKECYDPTWGRHKSRTKPVPGNHEYKTSGASGYYNYFKNTPPYYVYMLGNWRIYALNSEIDVSANSAQAKWLKNDLAASNKKCVMAYWHQPRWSSGSDHGSDPKMQAFWEILYNAKAELVIAGHEHNYERFAPMDKNGKKVKVGLQQIVVGTGGASLDGFDDILPASRVRNSNTHGVLKLTLSPGKYSWEFIPVGKKTFTDKGSKACH